jgi:aminopeptidase N
MLKTLIGEADFRRGMDLYFERCDGMAATVEDFLQAFAAVTGRDLSHFAHWYAQAGTPRVSINGDYDAADKTYRLDFVQETPPTPGQPTKEPVVIPVALGLVPRDGGSLSPTSERVDRNGLFVLDRTSDSLTFTNVAVPPVASVFRGFSAPVKVALDLGEDELLSLLRHDTDPFNRWQSAQTVAMRLLVRFSQSANAVGDAAENLAAALLAFLDRDAMGDPAFAAQVLALPSESEIAQEIGRDVDPDAIHRAREGTRATVGRHLAGSLNRLRDALASSKAYSPDAESAGRRALRNVALDLLAAGNPALGERFAMEQFRGATNMTDRLAGLAVLTTIPGDVRETAIDEFAQRYRDDPLVLDKWLSLQAVIPEPDTLDRVRGLMDHPIFSLTNPNRVRALIGSFALANPTQFHRVDGAGYDFVADIVLSLDSTNPQVAARLLTALGTWKTMEASRRAHAEAALRRIVQKPDLSPDVGDIAQRSLA